MPAAVVVALERELLGQSIAQLRLVHGDEINIGVVVVHQQVVLQILITGVRRKEETIAPVLDGQPCSQHVAFVAALMILVRIANDVAALWI